MSISTKNLILGSLLSIGGVMLVKGTIEQRRNKEFPVLQDTDMRNSDRVDEMESVDADKEASEKGLSQLDSTYRDEWVANGFPQTHEEMRELEEQNQ